MEKQLMVILVIYKIHWQACTVTDPMEKNIMITINQIIYIYLQRYKKKI